MKNLNEILQLIAIFIIGIFIVLYFGSIGLLFVIGFVFYQLRKFKNLKNGN